MTGVKCGRCGKMRKSLQDAMRCEEKHRTASEHKSLVEMVDEMTDEEIENLDEEIHEAEQKEAEKSASAAVKAMKKILSSQKTEANQAESEVTTAEKVHTAHATCPECKRRSTRNTGKKDAAGNKISYCRICLKEFVSG